MDLTPPDDLIDAHAAALHLDVAPATIRSWASRYAIPKWGRESRRTLYSLADLYAAERRASRSNTRRTA